MAGNPDAGHHYMRSSLESSLSVYLERFIFATPRGGNRGPAARARDVAESGAVSVNVDLKGGAIFLDDERSIRALAKEIKRLIGEDKRRGLAV